MRYELVFTAYNRPDYLMQTIRSWNAVNNLHNWKTTVFLEPSPLVEANSHIALMLNRRVDVRLNSEKLGVLKNPWNALNTAFEAGADFAILAEDDVLVSNDVLQYFEWASEEYVEDPSILTVNAYSRSGGSDPSAVVRESSFSPLIWGTWRSRWNQYLRDTWDKDYSTGKPDGSEAGWDWNINRILKKNNMSTIRPLQSRSDHIGEHFGTHMTPDLFEGSRGVDFKQDRGHCSYKEI